MTTLLARTLIGLLALVTLAACGDSGDSGDSGDEASDAPAAAADDGGGSAGSSGGGASDRQEEILAFYQCLRDNGLDVEDPAQDGMINLEGLDPNDPQNQAIIEGCSSEHLSGGGPSGGGGGGADPEALVAFTQCMRDQGIDMADPAPDGALTVPDGVDPESPEFQTAMGECQEHLQGGGVRMRR